MLTFDVLGKYALEAVLPAAGASGVLMYALLRYGGPRAAGPAAAVALAGGLLLGNRLRRVIKLQEDRSDLHLLLYATFAVLFIGLVARSRRLPALAAPALWLAGAYFAARLIIAALPEGAPRATWQLAGLVYAAWLVCEWASQSPPGGSAAGALVLAALAAGAVLFSAGSARMAEAAGLAAAAMAGVAVVAATKGVSAGGAVPGGVVLVAGLLLVGQHTTDSAVPPRGFVLVGLAPLALAPTLLPWARRLAGPRLGLLRLALVAVPCAIAARWAMRAEPWEW